MATPLKIAKKSVALRPSRIRRDPVREQKKVEARSHEREIWLGIAGVVLFALIIAVVTVGFSVITGNDDNAAAASADLDRFGDCDGSANCVIDGETIRIGGATVKIADMAAPQIQAARCDDEKTRGAKAAETLMELLNSGKVTTAGKVSEPDGQVRTKVLVGGRDVGAAMVAAGVARVPRDEAPDWCS